MFNFYDPYGLLPDIQDMPDYKNLSPEEQEEVRNKTLLYGCGSYVLAIVAVFAAFALFSSCAAQRAVYEHHHHHYEADTLAVQAAVDSRMQSWHAESEGWFRQMLTEERAEWSSHEDQKETITETVTTATDSLGRQIRTEQRTISRAMVNSQSSMVNSITSEYEARLREAVDSINDTWSQRLEAMQARVAQLDSTFLQKTPVGDARPWYRRLLDRAEWLALGIVIAIIALLVLAKKLRS